MAKYRVGVDVGGTFTDLIAIGEEGGTISLKLASTPREPEAAAAEAVKQLLERVKPEEVALVVHATTIAANALLGQLGLELPKVALITTKGFRDVVEIGRQNRPELYNLFFQRPRPLVPRELRFEVDERVGPGGVVWRALDEASVRRVVEAIKSRHIASVAVSLLHSYANPAHELKVKGILRRACPGIHISVSSEVDPEHREFERSSTTLLNALLKPIVAKYLQGMRGRLSRLRVKAPLCIMQSDGGIASRKASQERPVGMIESGPSAGVIAAAFYGEALGLDRVLSFDMGGTTAKAGVVRGGRPEVVAEYEAAGRIHRGRVVKGSGYPVRFPCIDLAECSAGGGTIAWVDAGGALRVGPTSAGADPGPACYNRGSKDPTVTDANLLLRRLNPRHLLAGEMRIHPELAERAVREKICEETGLELVEAAAGITSIVNSAMSRILRIVSIERGFDPRSFTLFAFGGAGPMHCCALAEELGVSRIVVPPSPGLFSSYGLLAADFTHSFVRGVVKRVKEVELAHVKRLVDDMVREAGLLLDVEGISVSSRMHLLQADMRYAGQAHELMARLPHPLIQSSLKEAAKDFHRKHRALYGYSLRGEAVEVVSLRLTAVGRVKSPLLKAKPSSGKEPSREARLGERRVYYEKHGGFLDTPVYRREGLKPGNEVPAPAIVEQYDATTIIYPGWRASVDPYDCLVMRRG